MIVDWRLTSSPQGLAEVLIARRACSLLKATKHTSPAQQKKFYKGLKLGELTASFEHRLKNGEVVFAGRKSMDVAELLSVMRINDEAYDSGTDLAMRCIDLADSHARTELCGYLGTLNGLPFQRQLLQNLEKDTRSCLKARSIRQAIRKALKSTPPEAWFNPHFNKQAFNASAGTKKSMVQKGSSSAKQVPAQRGEQGRGAFPLLQAGLPSRQECCLPPGAIFSLQGPQTCLGYAERILVGTRCGQGLYAPTTKVEQGRVRPPFV